MMRKIDIHLKINFDEFIKTAKIRYRCQEKIVLKM